MNDRHFRAVELKCKYCPKVYRIRFILYHLRYVRFCYCQLWPNQVSHRTPYTIAHHLMHEESEQILLNIYDDEQLKIIYMHLLPFSCADCKWITNKLSS